MPICVEKRAFAVGFLEAAPARCERVLNDDSIAETGTNARTDLERVVGNYLRASLVDDSLV